MPSYATQRDHAAAAETLGVPRLGTAAIRRSAASPSRVAVKSRVVRQFEEVNKELLLVFSLFVLAGILNSLVASQRVVLGLYTRRPSSPRISTGVAMPR